MSGFTNHQAESKRRYEDMRVNGNELAALFQSPAAHESISQAIGCKHN